MSHDTATASDREIVITRMIDAPPAVVFDAFADAERLGAWWGPDGFTTTTAHFEFRPGGTWEYIMHGPDGTDYPNHVEYREIVRPERIVILHGERAGDPESFVSTFTFAARGAATELTLRSVFRTKALRDRVVEEYGAIEGGRQTLARLAAHVVQR